MKFNPLLSATIALLMISSYLFSQRNGLSIQSSNPIDTTKVRINSTFLLLGTLNDYINHQYVTPKKQFDRYYEYEKPLMAYVDSIAKKDFNINFSVDNNCFISEKLTKKMDSLYTGNTLDESQFTKVEKKLSFILGVFLRNGEKINDDIYKIQLANSPKHQNVYDMLKQLDCPKIFFKRLDHIPRMYIIYFQATDLMKKYFTTVVNQQKKLLNSKINSLRTSETLKSQYKEIMAKENLKIIELFK